jgi:hypothetical protein
VYNRQLSFDATVIDKMPQCPENMYFDQLLTPGELNKVITHMGSFAAPGESGLSPMAMEKLPKEAKEVLLRIIQCYWNGLDKKPEPWLCSSMD